jgi:hypothetical protein
MSATFDTEHKSLESMLKELRNTVPGVVESTIVWLIARKNFQAATQLFHSATENTDYPSLTKEQENSLRALISTSL